MDVVVDRLDPLIELRTPSFRLAVPRSRAALIERLAALPGSPPREELERFFALQREVADATWALLDAPELLPPFDVRSLASHLARLPRLRPVLATALKPLSRVLQGFGLDGPSPFRTYVDALCQITVQCSADEAEAPFALGAMDYCYRGTGHVRGGIGRLAWALVDAIRALGGEVRFGCRVTGLAPRGRGRGRPRGWRADTRLGPVHADAVVANVLPRALESLVGRSAARSARGLDDMASAVESGWGACMLYAVVDPPASASPDAAHLELIQDPRAPLRDGNHLFCSLSGVADVGRAPGDQRTLTVSTHVSAAALRGLDEEARAAEVDRIQRYMREGLRALAPEWERGIVHAFTASPRTFERFTGRPEGLVGGVPRRAGLGCYRGLWPREVLPRLWLVGDSVFPGQSTLACAIGGHRAATSVARALPRR